MKRVVELCSGCVVRAHHEDGSTVETKSKFISELRDALMQAEPAVVWDVSFTSCMRYCPDQKVSAVIDRRMVMVPGTSVQETVQFLRSQLNRSKS